MSQTTDATDAQVVTVSLTTNELALVSNALNEVCNGIHIDDFEFRARLGTDRSEAKELLDRLIKAYDRLQVK